MSKKTLLANCIDEKIKVGPFYWSINDFCRGWLITGAAGSGKTVSAMKTILTSLFRDCPNWGGVVVDGKGEFYEIVQELAENFNVLDKLVVLRVGEGAANKYNLLSYPGINWRTYAGIIVDAGESIGVKIDPLWNPNVEELIEVMLQLVAVGKTPTFFDLYNLVNDKENMNELIRDLTLLSEALTGEQQMALKKLKTFMKLPPELKDCILGACKTMFNFFGTPEIKEVFCPDKNTVDFTEIDDGKIFVISMPQRYSRERNYFNTFLKLLFSNHALFRFGKPNPDCNLIAFVADAAHLVVTSSERSSDNDTVALIREARATFILATPSTTHLATKLDYRKLDALILNLASQIYFKVSDYKAVKLASEVFSEHTVSDLCNLNKYQCVIKHPDGRHKKLYLPPIGKKGKVPFWYYNERFSFIAPLLYWLQWK